MSQFVIVLPGDHYPVPIKWPGDKASLSLAIKEDYDSFGEHAGNYRNGQPPFICNVLPRTGLAVGSVKRQMEGTFWSPRILSLDEWFAEFAYDGG